MTQATKPLPDLEVLNRLIIYKEETGLLFWKRRTINDFKDERSLNSWNGRYALYEACRGFTRGYKSIVILAKAYMYHRIVWKMHYGFDPLEIDHIDGNKSNNIITNLRSVTGVENCKNCKMKNTNTSGITGVYKRNNKYTASICVERKQIFLGSFELLHQAVQARKEAEIKYGFHSNHGVYR